MKGRSWWPSLLLLLLATPLAAQDSARYQISWVVPTVDTKHPAPTLYHWQLLLGDTITQQPLTGIRAVGAVYGYATVYAGRYGYSTWPFATVTIARSPTDSLGPFRIAAQAAYQLPDSTWVLGPYAFSASWWVPPTGVDLHPGAPLRLPGGSLPNSILWFAIGVIPWP